SRTRRAPARRVPAHPAPPVRDRRVARAGAPRARRARDRAPARAQGRAGEDPDRGPRRDELKTTHALQGDTTMTAQSVTSDSAADSAATAERRLIRPRTDVYETRDALVLVADVPGADQDSIELSLNE